MYQSTHTGAQVDAAVDKALSADAVPTANSTNLVESGGVASAISAATYPNTTVARTKMLIIRGNGGTGSFTIPRKSSGITPGFLIVGGRSNVGTIAVFYNEWGEKLTIVDSAPSNWSLSFSLSADGTSSIGTITNNGASSAQFQILLWDFQ